METPIAFVIEDQMHLATLYEDALRLVGFDVVTIMNGLDAINQLELTDKPPNLILLDVNMPKISGREVYAHIQKNTKFANVPVVIATANSVVAAEMQEEIRPKDQLLVKPIGMRDLQNIAKQIQAMMRGEQADAPTKLDDLSQDSIAQAVSRSIQAAKVDTNPPKLPTDTLDVESEKSEVAIVDIQADDSTETKETDGIAHSEADTQESEAVDDTIASTATRPANPPVGDGNEATVSAQQSEDATDE